MKAEVLIDWLTFTVKGKSVREVIEVFLGFDPSLFVATGFCMNSYQQVYRFSDIFVMDCPHENSYFQNMGVCVSMSGNGCRTFERFTCYSDAPFLSLFKLIRANDCNVTRLDIACDDLSGALDMDRIIDKVQRNEINSRMTKRDIHQSLDGSSKAGSTVYIGAPSSDFRFRIYDKALEQGTEGHWVRVEMVLKQDNAFSFVLHIASGACVGKLAAQVLNDKLSFIERDDSNISRCSVSGWWADFVEEVSSLQLSSRATVHHPIEHVDAWVQRQIAPSLAMLLDALGWAHVFEMIMAAESRLTDRQLALIADFRRLFPQKKE